MDPEDVFEAWGRDDSLPQLAAASGGQVVLNPAPPLSVR